MEAGLSNWFVRLSCLSEKCFKYLFNWQFRGFIVTLKHRLNAENLDILVNASDRCTSSSVLGISSSFLLLVSSTILIRQ